MPGEGSGSALDDGKDSPIISEDELTSGRYILDGLGSNRYFMMGATQQTQESSSPCPLFPYTGQTGGVYAGSDGSRYASLHYGSVIPSAGFCPSLCAGRGEFGAGYQFSSSGVSVQPAAVAQVSPAPNRDDHHQTGQVRESYKAADIAINPFIKQLHSLYY